MQSHKHRRTKTQADSSCKKPCRWWVCKETRNTHRRPLLSGPNTPLWVQVCGTNGLGCHAGCQVASRCCTREEFEESIARKRQRTQIRDPLWIWNACKCHQKAVTRVSQAPRKGLGSSKNFKKKKKLPCGLLSIHTHYTVSMIIK